MASLDELMGSFANEKTASSKTDELYVEKKAEWESIKKGYEMLRGVSKGQGILNMLAPLASKMGWKLPMAGGLGALLPLLTANEGGFSGILSKLEGIPLIGWFAGLFSG